MEAEAFIRANDLPKMTIKHKYEKNEDMEDLYLDQDQVTHEEQVE
jgi:hypothetical protein